MDFLVQWEKMKEYICKMLKRDVYSKYMFIY